MARTAYSQTQGPRLNAARGMACPRSVLTDGDVQLIRALIAERNEILKKAKALTNAEIAKKFDVHVRTIDRISTREGWAHVPDLPEERKQ